MQTRKYIDIFVKIIDNFGDMGFVAEFLHFFQKHEKNRYFFTIYTNETAILQYFFEKQNITKNVDIRHVEQWRKTGEMAISFFHFPVKKGIYDRTIRVDYLSMNDIWLKNNGGEHIFSEKNHPIIELIPSPKNAWAWLLPAISPQYDKNFLAKKYALNTEKQWFSLFCYDDTLQKIDITHSDENVEILIFWQKNPWKIAKNITFLPFLSFEEMYHFFYFSDYIVTRGEVSFSQVLQMGKPFFWDMYHEIGGFPHEQSDEYLEFMQFSENFTKIQKKLWNDDKKIPISSLIMALETEKSQFIRRGVKNFCQEVKKWLES